MTMPSTSRKSLLRRLLAVAFLVLLPAGSIGGPGSAAGGGFVADVKAFGAKGDGKTDDLAAINRAVEAVNRAGGGTLRFPPGDYLVFTGASKGKLGGFVNLDGVSMISENATITVDLARKFRLGESYYGFTFDNCTRIRIDGFRVRGPITDVAPTGGNGVEFVRFRNGCSDIEMPDNRVSGMMSGVILSRKPTDPESAHVRNVRIGTLMADNTFYGFNAQYTGIDVSIRNLVTDTIHRSYFVFGAKNHSVNIVSKNDYVNDCYIKAYSGHGCDNLWIRYRNTESTRAADSANHVAIEWGDATPATHRGIHLDVDIAYLPGARSGGSGIFLKKVDAAGQPDRQDRGHRLEGLTITGTIRGVPHYRGAAPVYTLPTCAWGEGDPWSGIRIEKLTLVDSKPSLFRMTSLVGTAEIRNLASDSPFMATCGPRGKVVFTDSKAVQFTEGKNDDSRHEYVGCTITDEPSRRLAGGNGERNKRFANTRYGGRLLDAAR
jgi:hypothetical protein